MPISRTNSMRALIRGMNPRNAVDSKTIQNMLAFLNYRQTDTELVARKSLVRNKYGLSAADAPVVSRIVACANRDLSKNLPTRKAVIGHRIIVKYARQLAPAFLSDSGISCSMEPKEGSY